MESFLPEEDRAEKKVVLFPEMSQVKIFLSLTRQQEKQKHTRRQKAKETKEFLIIFLFLEAKLISAFKMRYLAEI